MMKAREESRSLLEVREWRKKTGEFLESVSDLPPEERQKRLRERIEKMLRANKIDPETILPPQPQT